MVNVNKGKKGLQTGVLLILLFVLWTIFVLRVDVQPVGVNGTNIGFATLNVRFHQLTGEHLWIYNLTDRLEVLPLLICVIFGALGVWQLIQRKSLKRVDSDIILLGIYYVVVILAFVFFEKFPINYRPMLIEGVMEASYPSSTTLLVLSVMPTLAFQISRRASNATVRTATTVFVILYSAFMVIGRLVSGVHWLTDIFASILLSAGLYICYRSAVLYLDTHEDTTRIHYKGDGKHVY